MIAQNLRANAKVNLCLEVHHRRDDGFHEVSTRIARISLADEISITPSESGEFEFTCSEPSIPSDNTNLVVRAAEVFSQRTGTDTPVQIHLEKHIPAGAGLGGGSSDAATTLVGLNNLFSTNLDLPTLQEMAASLGSDVPFFLDGTVADCCGRGERVSPVQFPFELPIVLLKPEFEVSSGWAYSKWQDAEPVPGYCYVPQITPWGTFENHLEKPVFSKYMILGEIKTWFLNQPEVHTALMSGSGATVFAVLNDPFSGDNLVTRAKEVFGESIWSHVGHTMASYID